ncbi:ABC transporter substrate-binding protein [Desulfolutivibrio sulfoxidireducens]|uniref:ABC transporter substrate-binding protein n=1 Tax=Desulfolutivibrio sulfoxidireducens TaxID=2773299 RepID=UPI00159DDA9A|nr:ABC transporter substrate-binding protein [Desulfolutivibrio sulfoxidireducens]QLA15051.1 ABC transporter substrate-binding protein [Desulfolutivibrio sulfoxidireducens]QLA18620.1 ABC transporter substrate-binding protein [Desulfolutivibrio sulfoxidireducens]
MNRASFAALLAFAILVLALPGRVLADDTIKVGAVLSVTGPASFLGEPEKNTVLMMVDQVNAAGGLLGKKLEAVILDDETDVNKAVLGAQRLIRMDKVVAVLGPTTSGNTLAIMQNVAAAEVPMISFSAAEKIVTPVNPWIFKNPQSDRHAVARILEHAKARGYNKLAILTVSDGFGQAGREVLKELIPAGGFELLADEVYGPKDTDMTAQLTKIKSVSPDAVICWGTNPGPAVVAKNRVQLGMTTPLYMSHGVASKKFIELAGEAAEGLMLPAGKLIVAAQLPDSDPQKKVLMDYTNMYDEKFHQPVSTFGGHGWDGVMLFAEAVKKGGSAEPKAVRDNLEKITGFVGVGGIFNFSPTDHNGLDASAFVMIEVAGGDWKILTK